MKGKKAEVIHLYGVDPGSAKDWGIFKIAVDAGGQPAGLWLDTSRPIRRLDEVIVEIGQHVKGGAAAVLSLDAPINKPRCFDIPSVDEGADEIFPFNVNPFSKRPCEQALSGRPSALKNKLRFPKLVQAVASLCGWQGEYRASGTANRSFIDLHSETAMKSAKPKVIRGVSVLGYMQAPHGPVVSLFLQRLVEQCPAVSFSPSEALSPVAGQVYVLESHPAVSMGIWALDGKLRGIQRVPYYKNKKSAGFQSLVGAVSQLAEEAYSQNPAQIPHDDALDAFVGLLNLLDLLTGKGDWFGCEELGYFLIPLFNRGRPDFPNRVGDVWEEAYRTLTRPADEKALPTQ